ncbi:hypothetical protein FACS1894159_02380 [Bacteroidia bacterium]|nr:hypothetical protein FACS1894159_02380 [Bacteroidia bacterium]
MLLMCAAVSGVYGQKSDYPLVGAQVFIEPGQSGEDIGQWFRILNDNNMKVCRIRMFESHVHVGDKWDFSMYDTAFDQAARYGIRIFATIFPTASAADIADMSSAGGLNASDDVGGFKFPRDERQLQSVAEYIRVLVSHYKDHPALYCWVLQNEPGQGSPKVPSGAWAGAQYKNFKYTPESPSYNNGYMRATFKDEYFLRYVTSWYLKFISDEILKYDAKHFRHVNPHQIFSTLPEYDFRQMAGYLTSLGASMHLSWHFGLFDRVQYAMGVSMMCDIIRTNAMQNPFWITELQGGNVTYSGNTVMCPTREEIAQWLWTGIGAGAQGVIFWTLNQRATGKEAGEWGMIDFQRQPSDRLRMASEVNRTIVDCKDFFKEAKPMIPAVAMLYNIQSYFVGNQYEGSQKSSVSAAAGRRPGLAMMRSMVGSYEALNSWGIAPDIRDMDNYDWNPSTARGRAVVLTDVISISSWQWPRITAWVRGGGTLIATGLTACYDENAHCVMQSGFPLKEMFGADLAEFKYVDNVFGLPLQNPAEKLPAHLWKGIIRPYQAQIIGRDGDDVVATVNNYGSGRAIWIPSLVEIGAAISGDRAPLADVMATLLREQITAADFHFARPAPGALMRSMISGKRYMTVVVNKSSAAMTVELATRPGMKGRKVFGDGTLAGRQLSLLSEDCTVLIWE